MGYEGPRTDFILETNVAQLVNSAVSAVISECSSSSEANSSISQHIMHLKSLLYEPEKCYCRVLIAGKFDKPFSSGDDCSWDEWIHSGRFCELTEDEPHVLTQRICAAGLPFRGGPRLTESEDREIRELVEAIWSSSSNRIVDISTSLRRQGYCIPTQEDVDAYIHGKTFVDRVLAMDSMNKKHAESVVFDGTILIRDFVGSTASMDSDKTGQGNAMSYQAMNHAQRKRGEEEADTTDRSGLKRKRTEAAPC